MNIVKLPRPILQLCSLLLSVFLVACASLPTDYDKPPSTAIRDTADTELARLAAPQLQPGRSGFYPLSQGVEALGARLMFARHAERAIDMQYYYILPDMAGMLLMKELVDAAERGVRVRILLDDISTKGYEKTFAVLSTNPNIEIRLANPAAHRKSRIDMATDLHRLDHRMHNKSITFDNIATIVGGRNMGVEYFGASDDFNYHDFDVLGIGPIADEVSTEFDLYWNADETVPVTAFVDPDDSEESAQYLHDRFEETVHKASTSAYADALQHTIVDRVFGENSEELIWAPAQLHNDLPYGETSDAGEPGPEVLGSFLLHLTEQASEELFVISPYFVPGDSGIERFRKLREQGVRCVVVTNSLASTDVTAVYAGYKDYQVPLLELGVELWEIMAFPEQPGDQPGAPTDRRGLHAKTFAIDRSKLFVGSFNWDPRSRSINTEMGVVIESEELSGRMVDAVSKALPGSAWQLRLSDKGKVQWIAQENGKEVIYDKPPQSTAWQRTEAGFTDINALEKEL